MHLGQNHMDEHDPLSIPSTPKFNHYECMLNVVFDRTAIGMQLFSGVKYGLNLTRQESFSDFTRSFYLLFQVLTGTPSSIHNHMFQSIEFRNKVCAVGMLMRWRTLMHDGFLMPYA